jgi:nucleotide sugar dehydrogenase
MNDHLGSGPTVVVGQGYVGLPLAMAVAKSGRPVIGLDLNLARVNQILNGHSPVEDVSSGDITNAMELGRYSITSKYDSVSGFAFAVITVPTPLRDGRPDLSFIESAARSLAGHISSGATIILESTTYPGTTEELLVPILEQGSGLKAGKDFYVGYSPERIDPGNSEWGLLNTPKVVSGINRESLQVVDRFYCSLGIPTVPVSGTREAELTKLLENTFRHVNIALVNELAMFSDALGVNIWESIDAASTKPFGFMKFTPGPGVGGHCLPVDPSYLSWAVQNRTGQNFRFIELANTVNSHMPQFVVTKALQLLAERDIDPKTSRILLFGLAYKANTSDTREAPAIVIANLLGQAGAEVFALDKHVSDEDWPGNVKNAADTVVTNYDLGIMLTAHENGESAVPLYPCDTILDTRNVLSGENVTRL